MLTVKVHILMFKAENVFSRFNFAAIELPVIESVKTRGRDIVVRMPNSPKPLLFQRGPRRCARAVPAETKRSRHRP